MIATDIQPGSTITNGLWAVRVIGRSSLGWYGVLIGMSLPDCTGRRTVVTDTQLPDWRRVPFEWTEISHVEVERYTWSGDHRMLVHETKRKP